MLGGGKVSVGDTVLTARHILVAVGGKPFVPDLPGREHVRISDDLFYLDTLPKRLPWSGVAISPRSLLAFCMAWVAR